MGNYRIVTNIKKAMLSAFACIVSLGFILHPAFAEEFSEQDTYDLILEVKRDRKTLSTAIFGLEKAEKYYVPIQELARIVVFKADTNLSAGTVKGFIESEENSYSLNVTEGTYTIRGKTENFDKTQALVFEQKYGIGDIYVTPELLNKIWPLELSFNPLKQTLDIQTTRKLPYQMAAERQRKRNKYYNKQQNKQDLNLDLPRIENNYKLFSPPALDFSSTTRLAKPSNGGLGQTLNISGRNDLLKTQANYNFSFDKEDGEKLEFENARFLLERKSYEDGDLPLGLKLFQAGDVRPRPSRLIDGSLTGRGILLSTEPQKQLKSFDQITVEGTAEPGWEVELYRGNELIGFQIVDDHGEYRFEDVLLNFNKTVIKTILYGPEGQIRESEEAYDISTSMLQAGKTTFEASLLDFDRDLILTANRPRNRPTGLAQNYRLKRGITSWLSAFTTFTNTPTKQKDHRYATLGFNLSIFGVSSLIEAYRDLSGGSAIDFRTAGSFAGANLNLRTAFLSDFESEHAGFDNAARTSDIEFTANRPFKLPFGNLGLRFKFDHERFKANPERTEFDFSQTYSASGLRLTHGNTVNLVDKNHRLSDGRINATYRINPQWQLRSLLNYDVFPDKSFRNLLTELRYKDGNKFTAAVDINRNFQDQGTRLGGNVSYDFDTFRTGLDVDWQRDQGFRAFLRATFSIAPYGKDGDYIFSSKNLSNKAALNGRVFLDKDYDGKFGPDDELIEEAKIDIGKRETGLSDSDGYARYIGSPRNEYENVLLDFDSLQNPFMSSRAIGYNTLLRPATAPFADFPVIETGVIDGTIYTGDGPLAGVRLQLFKGDEIIDTTSSAFDGFYTFEYIEPGTYIIRIDPSYDQLNIPPRLVSVTSDNLFLYGVDFQITEQAEEVACVETDENGRVTQDCRFLSTQDGTAQPVHTISDPANISAAPYNTQTKKPIISGELPNKLSRLLYGRKK